MTYRRRELDTLAVLRGIGARTAASATVRRLSSQVRSIWRRGEDAVRGLPAATDERFVAALRVAPSPLAECDEEVRFRILEREQPGARARIVERALLAAERIEAAVTEGSSAAFDDPRVSWEKDRLGRLVVVAAGVRATQSPGEAAHLVAAFERGAIAWIEANRPGETSAWASPLELGLRSFNLLVATAMVRPASLSQGAAAAIAATFVEHGRSIETRMEDTGLVVGSHLLGDLVGLYSCGAALQLAGWEPYEWRRVARRRLAREANRQVLGDGGGAEGSTGYARFVAELWVASLCCARAVGEQPAESITAAARGMLLHLIGAMTPDGRDLGIGDDDSSRVLPPCARDARDVAALAPLASAVCGASLRPEGVGWSEEAAWLGGDLGYERWRAAKSSPWPRSWQGPDFGVYVARNGAQGGDMVAVRAGQHGLQGAGGHAHNDPLSIAVWFDGHAIVVDPGTGIYLGRRAIRDRFRGVAAHATVCIDGLEPSPILPTRPFALPDEAQARVVQTQDGGGVWSAIGEHDGYRGLGLRVRREVKFDRTAGRVAIADEIIPVREDDVEHDVVSSFPVGTLPAEIVGDLVRLGPADAPVAWMSADGGGAWRLDPGALAPEYGTLVPGVVVRRIARAAAPYRRTIVISKQRSG